MADRTAVLLEIKGVWLRDSITAPSVGTPEYLAHLRERYGVTGEPAAGDRPVKGVGQLARSTRHLAERTRAPEQFDPDDYDRIIPVLVIHDPHLDAPLHSQLLAREFLAALGVGSSDDWNEPRIGRFRVAHLVLLAIDDLETLETSCKHFGFVDCLEQYAARCPDRNMSFHNFLATSEYRSQLRYNAWLASKGMQLLAEAQGRLFGDASLIGTVPPVRAT